jgi:hypothetical protein
MDNERLKRAVLATLEQALDAEALARAVIEVDGGTGTPAAAHVTPEASAPSLGAQKLLGKIVLSDLLDDAILAARPQDRTFPLRLFFAELGRLLASEEDGPADQAFCLASGLNFFFRAKMDPEAKVRAALETSRAFYAFAYGVPLDPELVSKSAPLLAALLTSELDKVRLEAVDHAKVFDSQVHERAGGADPTSSRIVRPETFLCRVSANNAVKAKAQVLT